MRSGVCLPLCVLALAACLVAPGPAAGTTDSAPSVPAITFTFELPGSLPSRYAIVIDSSGRASYRSDSPRDESLHEGASVAATRGTEPYSTTFAVSAATRDRLFKLAAQLRYFQGNFDYKGGHIANMGRKTLAYADPRRRHETVYNWSQNPLVGELTHLFQNISNTMEFGRHLDVFYRFDKLGLDGELKQMEQAAKDNNLAELQVLEPILRRIAEDRSVMHVARLRAQRLLARLGG